MVEKTVRTKNLSYMDSIVYLCEENTMEIEDVKKYLNQSIIESLEYEAIQLNFLAKGNTLDV